MKVFLIKQPIVCVYVHAAPKVLSLLINLQVFFFRKRKEALRHDERQLTIIMRKSGTQGPNEESLSLEIFSLWHRGHQTLRKISFIEKQ